MWMESALSKEMIKEYMEKPWIHDIQPGDRIAQGVVSIFFRPEIKIVDELSETKRGTGGFGHTGE